MCARCMLSKSRWCGPTRPLKARSSCSRLWRSLPLAKVPSKNKFPEFRRPLNRSARSDGVIPGREEGCRGGNYTNVNIWRGAELAERADPDRLLLGEGGEMRHLTLATVDDICAESLRSLVRTAIEQIQRFGNPTRGEAIRARD